MSSAGFKDYTAFIRAVYGAVQKHADGQRLDAGLLQPGRRADGRRPGPLGRERRGLSPRVPQGAALLHGGQQFCRQRPAGSRTCGWARPCTSVSWNLHDEASVKLLHESGSDWAFYNGGNRWTFGEYMYKAAKQFGMKFRISWHWNAAAGDPYYALDCREDDYSWCSGIAGRTAHSRRLLRAAAGRVWATIAA